MTKIDLFGEGYLCYGRGNFDDWCVYYVDKTGTKVAPTDIDYFRELKSLTNHFDSNRIYNDFIKIYDTTSKKLEDIVVEQIRKISLEYGGFYKDIYRIFSTIYMSMIAEENKKNTKLGKRIKRLGIYYLLIKL